MLEVLPLDFLEVQRTQLSLDIADQEWKLQLVRFGKIDERGSMWRNSTELNWELALCFLQL